jgi:ribonuclease HI
MKKTILLLALLSLLVLSTSCQKGEEVTVSKYFEAMTHNDKDTMAAMAIEPKDIEFKKFEVVSIDEPVVTELELSALEKKMADLTAQRKTQIEVAMDKKYAVEDLQDELEETRRRSKKEELKKKIEDAQVEQVIETEKVKKIMLDIGATKKAISIEKSLVKASTGVDKNFELYTGETHTSKVLVKVTLLEGSTQDYIFMLRKNILKMGETARNGRLVITKIATPEEIEKEKQAAEEAAKTVDQEVTEEAPAAEGEAKAEDAKTEEGEAK